MKRIVLIGLTALFSTFAAAQDTLPPANDPGKFVQLKGDQILKAYENKTMEGNYATYLADVLAKRPPVTFTEFHDDKNKSTYTHRGHINFTITGDYAVKDERLCYTYNDPDTVTGTFCFYVYRAENCYYHFADNRPLPEKMEDFDNWHSMAYRHEDSETCLPSMS